MTFQSDNGKAFVGDLTKELMRRSHNAQAHSTTYHSTDEWTSREAKQDASKYAQGVLLEFYDGLGQIIAASGGSVQKHETLNNGDQSFHDANRQGKSNALDVLLSRI